MRLLRILQVVARYRLDLLVPVEFRYRPGLRRATLYMRCFPVPSEPGGVRLRKCLEVLGPVFVKFGQVLSTRRDLFDDEIADELQQLQDSVPPFPSSEAIAIIESRLGDSVTSLFSEFEAAPLASASVAQVHEAVLPDGSEAIVKVIRPGIEKVILKDLELIFTIARFLERFWPDGKRYHLVQIAEDYRRTILDELDLQLEAANTTKLRQNWEASDDLYIPEIYWDLCDRNVLVMEKVSGISVARLDLLKAGNIDLERLAHLGVEIFFTQVFEHNFFHADMHPGNIMVSADDPEHPRYIALDCAIIGSLTEADQDYLARNLLAFFRRDFRQVAELHIESGWVPADTDVRQFETVIRSVCEPVFDKPIEQISFGKVVVNLFQTARRFNMEVQPQLVLLQKTLLNIEGLGRQIYPQLDLWQTAQPFMENWIASRYGPRGLLRRAGQSVPGLLQNLPELPQLAYDAMRELSRLGEYRKEQSEIADRMQQDLLRRERQGQRMRLGGLALTFALVLAWFPFLGDGVPGRLPVESWIVGSFGIYLLFIKP